MAPPFLPHPDWVVTIAPNLGGLEVQGASFWLGARRSIRRAVELECDVISDWWDEPVPHVATNLSLYGMWIETTFPLETGSIVVISFTPPRWRNTRDLTCFAAVRRSVLKRRAHDPRSSGMGIEFIDPTRDELKELAVTLRGLPPPLPSNERPPFMQRAAAGRH